MGRREAERAGRLAVPETVGQGRENLPAGTFWRGGAEFVEELAESLRGKRVLEICAGNGLLAGLLAARGVEVKATSLFSGMDAHDRGLFHPVEEMSAVAAVAAYGAESDVLLVSWPLPTDETLDAARLWGAGRPIAFIGELSNPAAGIYGGCASDAFFEQTRIESSFGSYRGNMLETAATMSWVGPELAFEDSAAAWAAKPKAAPGGARRGARR